MKNKNDTSSISFTAHYTGFIWYRHGLSERAFATRQGHVYFSLLRPFEYLARHLIGSDIQTTLLQRHFLIDRELETLIRDAPNLQILELACGLSPRGHRFSQKFPHITYVEADLPGMAARKRSLLESLQSLNSRHRLVNCNILDRQTSTAGAHPGISIEEVIGREFDTQKPLVIITEGLVNYFDLTTISHVWQRMANTLRTFAHGVYLTDIYPGVEGRRFSGAIRAANNSLRLASRSSFTLHFSGDEAMQTHFEAMGFNRAVVLNPDHEKTQAPKAHSGAVVRVVKAEI
jgi:O-methyltransferase involved in polyketide biosynthesis